MNKEKVLREKYTKPSCSTYQFFIENALSVGSTNLTFGGLSPDNNIPLIEEDYPTHDGVGWVDEVF